MPPPLGYRWYPPVPRTDDLYGWRFVIQRFDELKMHRFLTQHFGSSWRLPNRWSIRGKIYRYGLPV